MVLTSLSPFLQDGSRVYVQAMNGQTYGIQIENYTRDAQGYRVMVDGTSTERTTL